MTVIYVGNVDRLSTEENIRSVFEMYGSVASVNLMSGFAFVNMVDDQQAQKAISDLHNQSSWVVHTLSVAA